MRGTGLASAAVIACLALTACQDDPVGPVDPDDTAPPGAAASTTPTPTGPTPPPLPDDATADTARGAIEFVRHYIALMNYSAETGDTSEIRRASGSCETCDSYIDTYETTAASGGFSENPGWQPSFELSQRAGQVYRVFASIKTRSFRFQPTSSDPIGVVEPTTYRLAFDVSMLSARPVMKAINEQPDVP